MWNNQLYMILWSVIRSPPFSMSEVELGGVLIAVLEFGSLPQPYRSNSYCTLLKCRVSRVNLEDQFSAISSSDEESSKWLPYAKPAHLPLQVARLLIPRTQQDPFTKRLRHLTIRSNRFSYRYIGYFRSGQQDSASMQDDHTHCDSTSKQSTPLNRVCINGKTQYRPKDTLIFII